MYSAYNSTFDDIVKAQYATKKESYYCWACRKSLVLKQGPIKQPHFAHQSNESCTDGWKYERKTKWHIDMQSLFDTTEVLMEDAETGERHIADAVYQNIVFEFQHSPINAEEVANRTFFYLKQGYRVVWVVDIADVVKKGRLRNIDTNYNVYNWSRASRMFDFLPFLQHPDKMRIILYWEEYDVVDPKRIPRTYKDVGYFHHVAWCYQDSTPVEVWDEEEDDLITQYITRPDMRIFAVGKQQPLDNSNNSLIRGLFDNTYIDKKKCQKIGDDFFEEREELSWQYRY